MITELGQRISIDARIVPLIGFGSLLRAHIELSEISLAELAMKIPCDLSYLYRIRLGRYIPNHDFTRAISRALALTPQDEEVLLLAARPPSLRSNLERCEAFGRLLRDLRKRRGVTQSELARALEYDQSLLSKIERGKRSPPKRGFSDNLITELDLSEDEIKQLLSYQ